MAFTWDDLSFWHSGEWQVIEEHLDDARKSGKIICPQRRDLFAALDATPFETVRCCILAQDPYPNPSLATGIAFSIPEEEKTYPPTLENLFNEYCSDLRYPYPENGNLETWCQRGVLLLNAIPTCDAWKSLSHEHWPEWKLFTTEVLTKLSETNKVVFVLMGRVARSFVKCIDDKNSIIETAHPVPRASLRSKIPFTGSRIFSHVNAELVEQGLPAIDWRL